MLCVVYVIDSQKQEKEKKLGCRDSRRIRAVNS